MTYDEFGNELKTAQNASFKYLAYVDKLIETWTNLTDDQVMTVRPLSDWFPIKVERVKKVLREVKLQDDIEEPEVNSWIWQYTWWRWSSQGFKSSRRWN